MIMSFFMWFSSCDEFRSRDLLTYILHSGNAFGIGAVGTIGVRRVTFSRACRLRRQDATATMVFSRAARVIRCVRVRDLWRTLVTERTSATRSS
jgi:hypothetical protein